jgi:peptidoglycan/LPS O-acetylase OafA/YrhL
MTVRLAYDAALEGLRGIAIIAVILLHMNNQLFPGGWIGVDVFFVLSGYLITSVLRNEVEARGAVDLKRFHWHRILRLMPALWCLLLTLLPLLLFKHQEKLGAWIASASYTMNWYRAFEWGPDYVLGHTWSLAAEQQFYVLWPLAFILIRGRRPVVWLMALALTTTAWRFYLAGTGASPIRTYNDFFAHADPLLMGCILALVKVPKSLAQVCSYLWWLWLSAFLIFVATVSYGEWFGDTAGISLGGLIGVALLLASPQGPIRGILTWRPLVFTGKISYAFYLWHFPLLNWHRLPPLLAVVAAYLIATLSYFTVERYFRRLKNRQTADPSAI